jgi:cobaltochelatase CobS
MATKSKSELEKAIESAKFLIANPPNEATKKIAEKSLEKAERELAELGSASQISKPSQQVVQGGGDTVTAILAALKTYMESNMGGGLDSESIRSMISEYLTKNKISLDDLDKSVLDEIKKNQMVILNIPNFGLKIEVSSEIADIPNLYPIIDDVLAGNNVYLIGEAGGGKTYTAEMVAKLLKREYMIINCSQYTLPTEIVGGQTITGYQDGKLIDAWRFGKILILDEMPRLDPNTAGLFNDALAKSTKTKPASESRINSTNPKEAPFERNDNFALIGTGNIYPNTPPPPKYKANQQQDLSLLDRFSGSVYQTMYDEKIDQKFCRFQFLYDMLVGNYYQYTEAVKNRTALPEPKGLRTVLKANNLDELAVVSYRTLVAFRVAFEYELVRALAKKNNTEVGHANGKTLEIAFNSFLVAFDESGKNTILTATKYTPAFIKMKVEETIKKIIDKNLSATLTPLVAKTASDIIGRYENFLVADTFVPQTIA